MILTAKQVIVGDGKTILEKAGIVIQDGKILKIAPITDVRELPPKS